MKYNLVKASIEPDRSHATLWYANPDCVFEKAHKMILFEEHSIKLLMSEIADCEPVDLNNLPLVLIPEQFQTINAKYVEVNIGLHKHVSRKVNGRPVFTRCLYVFVPMVRCECSGNFWRPLYDPKQLAQEQINRYWIPVDED